MPAPPGRELRARRPPPPPPTRAAAQAKSRNAEPLLHVVECQDAPPPRPDGYRLELGQVQVTPEVEQGERTRIRFQGSSEHRDCLRECAVALARATRGRVLDGEGRVLESFEREALPLAPLELKALWLEAVAREKARALARERGRDGL